MSIYKNLLFQPDSQYLPHAEADYAHGYGNRVANRRAFPKLGHARTRTERPAPVAVTCCTAGACG